MSSTLLPEAVAPQPVASPVTKPHVIPTAGLRASVAMMPLVMLSLGHSMVDLYSSIIATLQPLLIERYALSLTQVGIIGGVFLFSSAVTQLFFGMLSDRVHSRMFAVLSPGIAGVILSSLLFASGFPMLLLLAFLGGLAVAAFHPFSTKEASVAGGQRRGLAVAIFVSCGTLGLSAGPAFFSTVIEWAGADSLGLAAIPALVVSVILFWKLPPPSSAGGKRRGVDFALLKHYWKPLTFHYVFVVLRSIVQVGLVQFLTVYLYTDRGFTFRETSLALTVCLFSAAAGSFSRRRPGRSHWRTQGHGRFDGWRDSVLGPLRRNDRMGIAGQFVHWGNFPAVNDSCDRCHGAGVDPPPGGNRQRTDDGIRLGRGGHDLCPLDWLDGGPSGTRAGVLGSGLSAAIGIGAFVEDHEARAHRCSYLSLTAPELDGA